MKRKVEILRLIAELEADYDLVIAQIGKNRLVTEKLARIEPDEADSL